MPGSRSIPAPVARRLRRLAIATDDHLDAARRRLDARFGFDRPRHIAAYRGYADHRGVELLGRVLANPPLGGPLEDDGWWDNLLNTYRRFNSDDVPGIPLRVQFRNVQASTTTDNEGYYRASLAAALPDDAPLWDNASIALADGSLLTPQPVLQVGAAARFGIISDIDDTVLQTSIVDWKTAAQLTFLHNARTRKPLLGVARLYQALQSGTRGLGRNPIFYVSNSPWNLYDLLDDFLDLNGIPFGPIFLRAMGIHPGEVLGGDDGHKVARVRELVVRFPHLRWILLGDSGQADAEVYGEIAREFGPRILAIYIRDVDPGTDSPRDQRVDGVIDTIAGTAVPMLRVADSRAIAEHALGLGLLTADALPEIAAEVQRDQHRPSPTEAGLDAVKDEAVDAARAASGLDDAGTGPGPD